MPPITSTTTSTSSRVTSADASVVSRSPEVGVPVRPAHGDADQLDRRSSPGGELVGLLPEQPHDLPADRAATQQRDPDRSVGTCRAHPDTSSRNRSSSVSRRSSTRAAPSRTATTAGRGSRLYVLDME